MSIPPPDLSLIDTHCHLDVAAFDPDRAAVLMRARAAGVGAIVVPAIAAADWDRLLACCARYPDLYPALGLHPVALARHRDADLDLLEQRLAATDRARHLVAVGEIGLDFHPQVLQADSTPAAAAAARQRGLFVRQLAMAQAARLPVLLHVRKAHDEVIAALRRARFSAGGIVHAFNGSAGQAKHYLNLGFCLGFGGMLTFERSTRLRRLAATLPATALVLETDAPDLTVASHRYQRNSPEYLPEILAALAAVRGAAPASVAAQTSANARALLRLPGAGARAAAGDCWT
ncbi:MAG: TatD family deoxyribonuclease [Chromatiaceae bacterium]|nr:MAG: TatD family deoxyribonuclease [Chromatiaceae bacterium]